MKWKFISDPIFKSDLINNMDHMRILGTEPSASVIICQTKLFKKLKSDAQIVSNQALAKWDGEI